ncbi:hypothetical protein GIB67_001571 [Kingdonia uniflora]|uniref:Uncharacterized protein n=1 Tax=Kingdonia uniflora TaxID=39325 RepID=A0A7J7L0S1_9MAGN|nr:hypothetical protein GIB67_001571 [Kingdonia uniflora]
MSSSSSQSVPDETSNYDEFSMQQSLLFSDSLKDLKNLRAQLYSAAEYFELSYTNDDQKQMVMDTLKEYAIKALINTVDHLGSVTYKVNGLLDENVEEVSGTEFRVSCIEQRLRTCQEFIDHEGLSQQSLVITTPKYHKRYLLPGKYTHHCFFFLLLEFARLQLLKTYCGSLNFSSVGETMLGSGRTVPKNQWCSLDDEDDWHQFKNAVQSTIIESPSSSVRKGRSPSPRPRPPQNLGTFSFTEKRTIPEKRAPSPQRSRFPLLRSGSFSSKTSSPLKSRPTTPLSSRPITPTNTRQRYTLEPKKSASMRLHAERESSKETEHNMSKSKRLLKALLSRRKTKKDESLYTFLDEY